MYADHLAFEERLTRGYQLGNYALLERIGIGGEGTVWSAWDDDHKRVVALKVVLTLGSDPFYAPMISGEFENQVHLLESLEHPNILPFYEFGVSNDYCYFATRYNCVGSLAGLLNAGPLSLQEALDLIGQIIAALEYLHRHKVVHRDLKPSNILIDSQRRAYLSDFGLARRLLQDTAPLHTGRGSGPYAPYEQHIPGIITPQSDIYSLGILIYEMLTGELPWAGTNDLLKQQSEGKLVLPDLQDTDPRLPSSLSEVLRYMTAFEWIKRPISVSEARELLIEALPDHLGSDTSTLHRPMPILDETELVAQDARYLLGKFLPEWNSETEAFPASLTHLAFLDSVLMQDEPHTLTLDDELCHFMRRGALAHGYRVDHWWKNASDRRAKKKAWEQTVANEEDVVIERASAQLAQGAQTGSFFGRPRFSSVLGRVMLFVMGLVLIFGLLGYEGIRQLQETNEQELASANLELDLAQANLTAAERELAAARAAVDASQEQSSEEAAEAQRLLQLSLAKVAAAEEALAEAQAGVDNAERELMTSQVFAEEGVPAPTDIVLSSSSVAENRPAGTIVGILSTTTAEEASGLGNDVTSDTTIPASTASLVDSGGRDPAADSKSRSSSVVSEQSGNAFTYSLVSGDNDNDAFSIEGNVLKTAMRFDFESKNRYNIQVRSDNGVGGTLEKRLVVFVTDEDDVPRLVLEDAVVLEGKGEVSITVVMRGVSDSNVTARYITSDGTATRRLDYIASNGTLRWAAGETGSRRFVVPIVDDDVNEREESFNVILFDAVNADIGDGRAIVTITNDDGSPSLEVVDVTVAEDAGEATISAVLSGVSDSTVKVRYAVSDGSAIAGLDYRAVSGTLTWEPGESGARSFEVPILDDRVYEPDETFTISFSDRSSETIFDGTAVVTIRDDEVAPTLTVAEFNAIPDVADRFAIVTVIMEGTSDLDVKVDYRTSDRTAVAGRDYEATNGTLTWKAGESGAMTFDVPILGDELDEPDEEFVIILSNPVNATIAKGMTTITITDDDNVPSLAINDVTIDEGDGTATVSVVLNGGASQGVTVDFATTSGGTATAGKDYTQLLSPIPLSWDAEETGSKTFEVNVIDDAIFESDETFHVTIFNPKNAIVDEASAVVSIADDDPLPSIVVSDVTVNESDGVAIVSVKMNGGSGLAASVNFDTADDTASVATSDYVPATGRLNWSVDEVDATRTFNVQIADDNVHEPGGEAFNVRLSSPVNAKILRGSATITIADDDSLPTLNIGADVDANEDVGSIRVTVTLNGASGSGVTVRYGTDDTGSSTAGSDYASNSGRLTWAPNEANTSRAIVVSITDDRIDESDESFNITLSNPSGAAISDGVKVVTIIDNDTAGVIITESGSGTNVTEGGSTDTYTIRLDTIPTAPVNLILSPDSQTDLGNGAGMATTLSFAADASALNAQTVTVTAFDDAVDEPSPHTSTISHSASSADPGYDGASVSFSPSANLMVNITDNDAGPSLAVTDATVVEGNSGAVQVTIAVTMTGTSSQVVTVDYLTVDGTATHLNNDYDRINPAQTLRWTPGQTGPKLFTVNVNGDNLDEGMFEEFFISFINVTNATMSDTQITVTIIDDDAAGVTINQSGGSTSVAEGGATDSYTIRLDSVPAAEVDITLTPTSQIDLGSGAGVTLTLVFAPNATALTGRTVTVAAVDDAIVEASPHTTVIDHSANSTDPHYNGASVTFLPSANVTVSITDNDPTPQ